MHSNQHPAVMTAYVSTSANAYLRVVKLTANTNAEKDWLQPYIFFYIHLDIAIWATYLNVQC